MTDRNNRTSPNVNEQLEDQPTKTAGTAPESIVNEPKRSNDENAEDESNTV